MIFNNNNFNSYFHQYSHFFNTYQEPELKKISANLNFDLVPLMVLDFILGKSNFYNDNLDFALLFSGRAGQENGGFSYFALFPQQYFIDDLPKLKQFLAEKNHENLPDQWLFGNFSYEFACNFENLVLSRKNQGMIKIAKNDGKTIVNHDFYLANFAVVVEFNHYLKQVTVFSRSDLLRKEINLLLKSSLSNVDFIDDSAVNLLKIDTLDLQSNFTDLQYLEAIDKIKQHIVAGDFYQTNLTRKFFGRLTSKITQQNAVSSFISLATNSNANYASLIKQQGKYIVSASPELFLAIENNKIISQPIKGTAPRGKNTEEDQKNYHYLKNSPKEQAENLMIVDLVRNDLARSCKAGSIKVDELFKVTAYNQVFHLSSVISGELLDNVGVIDAIGCSFPPGSMTGAPKIKAIEIASKFEGCSRGIYSGSIAVIKNNNSAILSVVIRTVIFFDCYFEFQVGGAITFDSQPQQELAEIYHKAQGIAKMLNLVDFYYNEKLDNI